MLLLLLLSYFLPSISRAITTRTAHIDCVLCFYLVFLFFVECQLKVSLIYRRENSGGGTRASGDLNAARKKKREKQFKNILSAVFDCYRPVVSLITQQFVSLFPFR